MSRKAEDANLSLLSGLPSSPLAGTDRMQLVTLSSPPCLDDHDHDLDDHKRMTMTDTIISLTMMLLCVCDIGLRCAAPSLVNIFGVNVY